MARPGRRLPALLLTLSLLLTASVLTLGACGDGDTTTTSRAAPATTAGTGPGTTPSTAPGETSTTAASIQDLTVVDEAAVAGMDLQQLHELVKRASDLLADRLGGDEAAFCAVLIALDRGHDFYQIATGALNDRLEADGTLLSADGSVLEPVRLGDGFIQLSQGAQASQVALGGALVAGRSAPRPAMPASYSPTEPVADTSDSPVAINAKLGGTLTTLADIYDHFTPVRERYGELMKESAQEAAFVESTTRIVGILVARGYSAEQITEAIVLDGVTLEDLENSNSWGIKHPSGVALRPRFAPVALADGAGFPPAEKDAPGGFVWADVEAGLDAVAAASASTSSGDGGQAAPGSGNTPSGGAGGTATDPDGIANGLYLGEVYIIVKPAGLLYEIPESVVELEVTDDGIVATVEYVTRYSAAETLTEVPCIATFRRTYMGSGAVTNPLALALEPIEQEFISVEGSQCGGVEEFLTELFAKPHTLTLAGTFIDNRFEGEITSTLGVRAATGR